MSLPLIVHDRALEEVDDAALWYEEQRPGLGLEFVAEISRSLDRLRNQEPTLAQWVAGYSQKKVRVRRFPYTIIYVHEESRIIVLAVAHAKREPGYWRGRTIQ